jgi:hypothetical protein
MMVMIRKKKMLDHEFIKHLAKKPLVKAHKNPDALKWIKWQLPNQNSEVTELLEPRI